jgi:hypothetical protein
MRAEEQDYPKTFAEHCERRARQAARHVPEPDFEQYVEFGDDPGDLYVARKWRVPHRQYRELLGWKRGYGVYAQHMGPHGVSFDSEEEAQRTDWAPWEWRPLWGPIDRERLREAIARRQRRTVNVAEVFED